MSDSKHDDSTICNRYDFVLLFDVQDGNPNGDPDAGNLPRLDAETGQGLVTDVSLKRKVRNFIGLTKQQPDGEFEDGFDIYVKEKAVLGHAHVKAFEKLNINLGEASSHSVPRDLMEKLGEFLDENPLPEDVTLSVDGDGMQELRFSAVAEKKAIQAWLKEVSPPKPIKDLFSGCLKDVKARKPTREETERGRAQMCQDFYDIRTFGAVLSLKTAPNCGQVRGPVQMTFARSVDPIIAAEHSITRMAVATEAEAENQQGDNRTMGRKHTVPYGLYRGHGFISAFLAKDTKFRKADLDLFWQALRQMFEHDRSAARGQMATRGLYVFKHDSELGNAPAHELFDLIRIERRNPASPPRAISDYAIESPPAGPLDRFPNVELIKLVAPKVEVEKHDNEAAS
ncbi:type I-C CRISPR-associated protein Cas7/Csd2 [Halochromatium glycolicum]|uniref:Type I-C CRISPR-associated protein Cas7/Csd2 n=1 Tax=Halochromatium glycolicum TaxID=85075 RepID=A0AAJ0X8W2_9GAMM|nr:type I-C CRISPR-associated protein Cas7/Csd2 [Halochromatium glycolicum]MBK1703057.1 type I-C CRISPR-associated protein Cas7/Csd2 [Halochromatium glycolicum]